MKKLPALLLAALLLCGCSGNVSAAEDMAAVPVVGTETAVSTTVPDGFYDHAGALEQSTNGAVQVFPLTIPHTYGLQVFGDGLLLFSGTETTTLTLLTGDQLHAAASIPLDFRLSAQEPSLRIHGSGLSYFDSVRRETVVLDASLREVRHIAAPQGLVGSPILSEDRNTLYYCTAAGVKAWDLEKDIRRTLKEMAYSEQALTGLHLEDSLLQCRIQDGSRERTLFLSTQTGQLLHEQEGSITLSSEGEHYYASFSTGITQALLFGEGSDAPMALVPADIAAECTFLPALDGAVTVSPLANGQVQLDYYALISGLRLSRLSLDAIQPPPALSASPDGHIYVLSYDPNYGLNAIYRWDPTGLPTSDGANYTGRHYTADDPDLEGLAQCQAYADRIGDKHGIGVLVWEDALAVQPWDYDFEGEYLTDVLQSELAQLEDCLSRYPEGMLADTASHFTSLKICLVRQITGSAESGSLSTATGIQFLDGSDAYVVIAVGEYSRQALYHELFHVMETHIWAESTAFDQWEKLNPAGFAYDLSYAANAQRDSGVYLQAENRAFIDTYSMSYPKEDRARIMEYAMLPGNRKLFQAGTLQRKLTALCEGIREAYGLKKSPETYLWEQYLEESLAFTQ